MRRRHFLQLALSLSVAGGGLLYGCGGGSGGGSASDDAYGRGEVAGNLFVDGTGALVFGAAPAGASPAREARLEVVGEGVAGSVGADGSFRLAGIRAGARTLRVALGAATKDIPLTVIADATVSLTPPPVSRDAAFAAAKAAVSLPADALVCASQQPLPAGTILRSAENSVVGAAVGATLATPQWLFFVDLSPGNRFGHPTKFVLIDARSGAVAVEEHETWPVLNGCQHYAGAGDDPAAADIVQPGRARLAPSPALRASSRVKTRAEEVGKTLGVVVAGYPRYDMYVDTLHAPTLLGRGGIPAGTLTAIRAPNSTLARVLAVWGDACRNATEGDTVFFYISSHGMKAGYAMLATGFVAPTGAADADTYNPRPDGTKLLIERLTPADLLPALQTCLACDAILMIDTCYSGVWATYYASAVLPRKAMTLTVLAASDASHLAGGREWEAKNAADVPPPGVGAVYTNFFLDAFGQIEAGAGGGAVNLRQAHDRAVANLVRHPNVIAQTQNPQFASLVPPSGIECGVQLTPASVNVDPKDLKAVDFEVRVDSVRPADGAFTFEFATAGTQGSLVSATSGSGATIRSEHAVVGYLAKTDAGVGKTEDVTVKVFTKESAPRLVGSAKAKVTIKPPNALSYAIGTYSYSAGGPTLYGVLGFYTFRPTTGHKSYYVEVIDKNGFKEATSSLSQASFDAGGVPVTDINAPVFDNQRYLPAGGVFAYYNLGDGLVGMIIKFPSTHDQSGIPALRAQVEDYLVTSTVRLVIS